MKKKKSSREVNQQQQQKNYNLPHKPWGKGATTMAAEVAGISISQKVGPAVAGSRPIDPERVKS